MTRVSMPELLLEEQLKDAGIPYEREFWFAPPRKWRSDFMLGSLLVEIEGGAYVQGRHTRGSGFEKDAEKYNAAVELGYRVLRYTPAMIESGDALAQIQRVLGR